MIKGENFKIMVGGQVVGMAKEAKFSIAEDDAGTKEFSDPWRTPDIKQSWDISCDAMVRDAGDVLRDLLNGKEKWDVTIGQEVGKLPRKMKKALHSKRMSKWKRKVASYINRRQIRIHDAECIISTDIDANELAKKIASERYGAIIAGEQTMYPYLRVGVLRHYGNMEHAFFDFNTGELVLIDDHQLAVELPSFIKVRRVIDE